MHKDQWTSTGYGDICNITQVRIIWLEQLETWQWRSRYLLLFRILGSMKLGLTNTTSILTFQGLMVPADVLPLHNLQSLRGRQSWRKTLCIPTTPMHPTTTPPCSTATPNQALF